MTEFGKTLREAREQKGLTVAQIAEQTHLLHQIVEDLEREDFHRISAPIYGRGFVKLYCEAVGLDPKPLVDEFMAILNGEREPAIKIREVALPPEEEKAKVEGEGERGMAEQPPPQPVYTQPELVEPPPSVDAAPRRVETVSPLRDAVQGVRPETRDPNGDERPEAREATPPRQYHPDYASATPPFRLPVNYGRFAILAGGAILIIALLILGGRALYRASMGISETPDAPQEEKAEPVDAVASPRQGKNTPTSSDAEKTPRPQAPAVKRTPKSVPPLYID